MQAGRLRHRVTIQKKTATRNTYGEEVITWGTEAEVWAAIEPLRGREYLEARQVQAEVTTRIRIRYRTGIIPEMRVIKGSRIWTIEAVIHLDEMKQEMHLMCREAVA